MMMLKTSKLCDGKNYIQLKLYTNTYIILNYFLVIFQLFLRRNSGLPQKFSKYMQMNEIRRIYRFTG